MPADFPNPETRHPVTLPDGNLHIGTVYLRAVIDHPRFDIGDYSYASSAQPPDDWASRLAPYLFPDAPDKLVLGKFCQIADGVVFITRSANHRYDGFSSYPFAIFDRGFSGGFADARPSLPAQQRSAKPSADRDTVIGNDVWIGQGACILPGAQIGDGVIVGARAVVAGQVPPYSVVVGNPARVVRSRFDRATVSRLRALAWWDWPIAHILAHEAAICGGDLAALERAFEDLHR